MSRTLVLSSSSPARRALLARLKIPFIVNSPDIDETPLPHETVDKMLLRLAEEKAKESAKQFPDALIIGCDQVGVLDNAMLTKPISYEKAVKQLRMMSGKTIRFKTAICLYDARNQQLQTAIENYDVTMRELSDEIIHYYLQHENALQCAGSCQVEGLGIILIRKLEGEDYTALIGLPLIRLTEMLQAANNAF